MAHNFTRGPQTIDDLIAASDPEGNTKIDFSNDKIDFIVGGNTVVSVTPTQISASLYTGNGSSLTGISGGGGTVATAVNDTTGSFNISNIQDGQYLKRSGNNIIGSFIMMAAIGISNETEAVKFVGTANDTLTGIYAFSGTAVLA